ARQLAASESTIVAMTSYGQWSSVWQGPWILFTAPFATDEASLGVPWDPRPWFWSRYEIYFGHDGIPFAISLLAMPFVMIATRREHGWRERMMITAAALIAFAAMLPVRYEPLGLLSISLPRFTLFLVPVVLAWTIPPLMRTIVAQSRLTWIAVYAAAAAFTLYGVDMIVNDRFAPLDYVLWERA